MDIFSRIYPLTRISASSANKCQVCSTALFMFCDSPLELVTVSGGQRAGFLLGGLKI